MQGFAQYADWFYLVGAILFILTLRGLSGPKTAIMGNRYGMAGMALAVLTTFFVAPSPVIGLIVGAMVAGAAIGIYRAQNSTYDSNARNSGHDALLSGFVGGMYCDCCGITLRQCT
jgi:NAD/NADP transhydrogenase beta subunit